MVKEVWNSRLGAILAVAGSAVGLGNFLRFPGQAAQYGGGAFMIAYFIALVLLGLPICWAEWTMGRKGGELGYNSYPGIMGAITGKSWCKWVGVLGVLVPVIIYMYYVYIEAWCLGYAVNFLLGNLHFTSIEESKNYWFDFIGVMKNGSALHFGIQAVGVFLIIVVVLNLLLIYRGISKGIEWFCKIAMPLLVIMAIVVLVRVLTLGTPNPDFPDRNVVNGLGFMWNPDIYRLSEQNVDGDWQKVLEITTPSVAQRVEAALASGQQVTDYKTLSTGIAIQPLPAQKLEKITLLRQLMNPQMWLAAASQIFFSLSVGFGVILNYASYLRKNDDVVLSGLTATSANEFCEVSLGGLITIPAAYIFLGTAGLAAMGLSSFTLGFQVLPMVFSNMPMGALFGFLFFFLLFLAAITSSLSMLQPAIAFIEESLSLERFASVTILALLTIAGTAFVWYFSADVKALDTLDFWAGSFLIFVLATCQSLIYAYVIGIEKGWKMTHDGSAFRIPNCYKFIMKYVTPTYLLTIFVLWVLVNIFGFDFGTGKAEISGYIKDLFYTKNAVALMSVGIIAITALLIIATICASPKIKQAHLAENHYRE